MRLTPKLKTLVEAEFYVVFAPDASRNAQVVEVKFINGDESLKPFAAELKQVKYRMMFPDSSPTKIVRRGTLACAPSGACTFIMLSPDLVTAID